MFKLEILEIGEMIWVSDSSENLKSVIQMGCLVVNLAVKEPVDRKVLEEDDTKFLENSFFGKVWSVFIVLTWQNFSQFFYTVH